MYDTTTFLQSELDYRRDRIKQAFNHHGKRRRRIPRVRRTAPTPDRVR